MAPLALYVHIPFCQTKCAYCDFNTYARLERLIPGYVQAVCAEIRAWGKALGHPPLRTVFLGGGTPSLLAAEDLAVVLDTARHAFGIADGAEVTAEANPNDVMPHKATRWLEVGVTRVSMGVQSFDDRYLELLTRRHRAEEAAAAYRTLRQVGFGNVNLDLMYGLPNQRLEVWRDTLRRTLELGPPHVSLYALTVEEGTPLWKEVREGRVPSPDPDAAAEMYELAEDLLATAGYRHYEISNWALPGFECRHNLVYWRNEPFLGVGPGAHSYLNGERFWNIKAPGEYIRRLTAPVPAGQAPPVIEGREAVGAARELEETLVLGLRLDEGVRVEPLTARFGVEALRGKAAILRECRGLGLVEERDGVFTLTRRGRLLSNEVFARLVGEASSG